ncbi:MAG: hypothetical protein ABI140_00490 [Jatrophihabitantaceae bacterium]
MSGRRPAFDPSRLDDDLDQLLPPPSTAMSAAAPTAPLRRPAANGADLTPEPPEGKVGRAPADRPARGSGGRPNRSQGEPADAPSVSAVRIPKALYDAVVGELLAGRVERPSYAQIVAWTCEDHPDDVLAELDRAVEFAERVPRGRKLATEVVPLAVRFRPEERRALEDLVERSASAGAVTRTAAVTAALRVAVKHGLSTAPDDVRA